ncbi:hypothetical protein RGQ15_09075 [Paracoccus sp. MBLB3053]|uniref:Sulfotransferase family protein n=1 Tax=Paracoccus aurantius TaxID=3073814 RepID=A0ABU2HRR2_9RHOB|nr:hypothetical protein [Paracoccus sp. MBLB3053]MDS9467716.1 hypothetical protein [Paracoccus sp. MBLB3053]
MKDDNAVNKPRLGTQSKAITFVLNPQKEKAIPHTVVVLGVERGGTSMVSGVIRALGVCMGKSAGLNHEDPSFLTNDPAELRSYIAQRNEENALWGFKMPKATMKLDFFEKELRNPIYVVVYRNTLSILDSWMQRGAGQIAGVLDRIHTYQEALNTFYAKTKSPVLLVNYDRVVQNAEASGLLAEQLADFMGLEIDAATRARAISMVTGEGGGYVNLPEYFFLCAKGKDGPRQEEIALREIGEGFRDLNGWISNTDLTPKLVMRMADGSNVPKRLRLRVQYEAGDGLTREDEPLRMFFRFTDNYIDAHSDRPKLRNGLNVLDIETSGTAREIAFGPSMTARLPCKFKLSVEAEVLSQDIVVRPTLQTQSQNVVMIQPLTAKVRKGLKRFFRH